MHYLASRATLPRQGEPIDMFEWLTEFVERSGYFGIALLMLLENVFPPVPSELIMPMAGFAAAEGSLHLPLVIVAGSIGSLAGAFFWYYLGRWMGRERVKKFAAKHGRFLTVTPEDIDRATEWFCKHSGLSVFIGRLVPAVRTLISLPAGVSKMPISIFLLYSSIGTVLWTGLLAIAGYQLQEEYEKVSSWINPISKIIVLSFVLWYIYRVITFRSRKRS